MIIDVYMIIVKHIYVYTHTYFFSLSLSLLSPSLSLSIYIYIYMYTATILRRLQPLSEVLRLHAGAAAPLKHYMCIYIYIYT